MKSEWLECFAYPIHLPIHLPIRQRVTNPLSILHALLFREASRPSICLPIRQKRVANPLSTGPQAPYKQPLHKQFKKN